MIHVPHNYIARYYHTTMRAQYLAVPFDLITRLVLLGKNLYLNWLSLNAARSCPFFFGYPLFVLFSFLGLGGVLKQARERSPPRRRVG